MPEILKEVHAGACVLNQHAAASVLPGKRDHLAPQLGVFEQAAENVEQVNVVLIGPPGGADRVIVRFACPWIPERSATRLREADLDVLSKLGQQGLEWRLEPEAFAGGGEVGREDDLVDVLVGCAVDIEMARQPST